jgi:hypothetical protein
MVDLVAELDNVDGAWIQLVSSRTSGGRDLKAMEADYADAVKLLVQRLPRVRAIVDLEWKELEVLLPQLRAMRLSVPESKRLEGSVQAFLHAATRTPELQRGDPSPDQYLLLGQAAKALKVDLGLYRTR